MPFFKEELKQVKAFAFDVDGVLSSSIQSLGSDGNPVRTTNIKDGFAIVHTLKMNFPIAIISGGYTEEVRLRYEKLGVKNIYLGVKDKVECLNDFMRQYGLNAEDVLFMGDDLPDYQVMKTVGLPFVRMMRYRKLKKSRNIFLTGMEAKDVYGILLNKCCVPITNGLGRRERI